jgi:hydrogenase maturation factor HypF (carbamoyltransferase family)
MAKEFNYCIAFPWDKSGALNCYSLYGNEVHFGTQDDAEETLAHANKQMPNSQWKIYKVTPVNVKSSN